MLTRLSVLPLLLAISAPVAAQAPKPPAVAAAEAAVRASLKDPESARFAEMRALTRPNARGEPTEVVCGTINAKNGFGGYTGAKPLVFLVKTKMLITPEAYALIFPEIHAQFCR